MGVWAYEVVGMSACGCIAPRWTYRPFRPSAPSPFRPFALRRFALSPLHATPPRWSLALPAAASRLMRQYLRQKLSRSIGTRILEEDLFWLILYDLAPVHEDHPVGDSLGEAHLMGDYKHSHSGLS
jgi:hypothetical protein